MVRQILSNNNEKCYKDFSPKIFTTKGPYILVGDEAMHYSLLYVAPVPYGRSVRLLPFLEKGNLLRTYMYMHA
jgi:hypothetical protein